MAKLKINGREYEVPASFTLGELADMEKITGQGYDLEQGGPLALLALAAIAIRRVDKTVTLEQIRDLGPEDVKFEGAGDAVPPSEQPASDASAQRSSDASSNGSEHGRALTLAASGDPTSRTGADFDLATSPI